MCAQGSKLLSTHACYARHSCAQSKEPHLLTGGRASSVLGVSVTRGSGLTEGDAASLLSQLLALLPRLDPKGPWAATEESAPHSWVCPAAVCASAPGAVADAAVLLPSALPAPAAASPAAPAPPAPPPSLAAGPWVAAAAPSAAAAPARLPAPAPDGMPPLLTLYFLDRGRAASPASRPPCPPLLAAPPRDPRANGSACRAGAPPWDRGWEPTTTGGNMNWLLEDACTTAPG